MIKNKNVIKNEIYYSNINTTHFRILNIDSIIKNINLFLYFIQTF